MSAQYEDTLLDFDLDFLHQTANKSVTPEKSTVKPDRCRKSVLLTKKKIIATDSLIRKYYEKKEEVDQIEKTLSVSKEEYKQTCIEFKNLIEKCNIKEREAQTLRNSNVELQEKYDHAQNVVAAMQSHANQLQNLVKQKETTIESLTIENQLNKSDAKDYEKKFAALQKQNEELMRHICLVKDVVFGKKKLKKHQKEILLKYDKNYESDNDSLFGDQSSDHDTDTENDLTSPAGSKLHTVPSAKDNSKKDTIKGEYISFKDDNGHDSDCSNEMASADTGRGSSLAFSDGEKCFNSPDYCITHSPVNPDTGSQPKKLISTATSPIKFVQNISAATSPVFQYEDIQITLSPISKHNMDENNDMAFNPIQLDESDINKDHYEMLSNSSIEVRSIITPVISDPHSDICIDEETTSSCPVIIPGNDQSMDSHRNDIEKNCERKCLELNNSKNLDVNNTGDNEIEMILQRMRLHHTLLTPIPNSPSKPSRSSTVSKAAREIDDNVCKDAEKIREENKVLNEKVAELAQEIVNIKDILRDKQLLNNNSETNRDSNDNRLHNSVSSNVKTNEKTVSDIHCAQLKKDSKKLKRSVNKTDVRKTSPVVSQKTNEKYECQAKRSNSSLTSHPINSMTRICVSNNVKDKAKTNINDEAEFEDILPISPVTRTKDPVNSKCSSSLTQRSEVNSSSNISDDIGEDFLPLSSMLESEREPDESTRKEIVSHEPSPCDKKNVTEQHHSNNASKPRKLTKLEKMRNKLLPKSKIKNISSLPIKKLRTRPKQLPHSSKQITEKDNAASLNDKDVYEKALKVMSELKSKEQSKKVISPCMNKLRNQGVNQDMIHLHEEVGEKTSINLIKAQSPCRVPIHKTTSKNAPQVLNKVNNEDKNEKKIFDVDKCKEDILGACRNVDLKKGESDIREKCGKEPVVAVSKCDDTLDCSLSPPKKIITTRSRSKFAEELNKSPSKITISDKDIDSPNKQRQKSHEIDSSVCEEAIRPGSRKRPKRASVDKPDIECKRMLRSSTLRQSKSAENTSPNSSIVSNSEIVTNVSSKEETNKAVDIHNSTTVNSGNPKEVLSYDDIEMFTSDKDNSPKPIHEEIEKRVSPKDSIFCVMVDKFGKQSTKNFSKKLPDSVITSTSKLLQEEIAEISEQSPSDAKFAMNKLVDTILNWGYKQFMAGFMAYLKDPQRKIELFNKISSPPAPPMTKAEQILLYVISQLRVFWSSVDVVDCTLRNIEYMLFKLNRTPEFDTIESTSHFYAVLCRYFKLKSRLRLFMLDAMYCIQFKAVPLIKQCLEVWMHVLPLAHMGIAKSPLVTCMVYLLHFYKCDDRFNRVQDIRNILKRKYFYEITDWNEPKIIEMFKSAINNVRAVPMERKLLRIALIVIAKRHGPRWCQNNIIKKMLLPMIESNTPDSVKIFCVSILGPLLKPYPVDMKVHCEVVMNQLLDILKQNPSHAMEEAIFTSFIYMSKHNYVRVIQSLLAWKPQRVSPQLERLLQDFVREKPLKAWKSVLSKIQLV